MTRQVGSLALAVGLGALLASGCASLWATNPPAVERVREPEPKGDAGPPGSSYNPLVTAGPLAEPRQDPEFAKAVHHPEPPREPEPPPTPAEPPPPAPQAVVTLEPKVEPDEPLLAALRCYLQKRPEEALELLQRYDKANQEMLLALLPLAVRLTEGTVDDAKPQELAALIDQLHSLSLPLRKRAPLRIAKMCFCREIQRFGRYEPLREDEALFQAGCEGRPGDQVQVYVEVRNFTSEQQGPYNVTKLASNLEVRNYEGKAVWSYAFPDEPDTSRTPRQDYFINYRFHVPAELAPGPYTLWITVQDVLTNPPRPPTRRSLDFRVTANGAAHGPRGGPGYASRTGGGGS